MTHEQLKKHLTPEQEELLIKHFGKDYTWNDIPALWRKQWEEEENSWQSTITNQVFALSEAIINYGKISEKRS